MERTAYSKFPKNRNGPGYEGRNREYRDALLRSKLRGVRYRNPKLSCNHLVGALLELQRHIEAEHLSRFDIDHQLVFRRRLHRKVSRLLALENAIGLWRIVTE